MSFFNFKLSNFIFQQLHNVCILSCVFRNTTCATLRQKAPNFQTHFNIKSDQVNPRCLNVLLSWLITSNNNGKVVACFYLMLEWRRSSADIRYFSAAPVGEGCCRTRDRSLDQHQNTTFLLEES